MKKTVSTFWYCSPLRVKTPSQNFWTLFTTATMRQSSRWFASSPVRHSCETCDGVGPLADALVVERPELAPEPSAAREGRHEHVDDEDDDSEPAAADGEPSRAAAHAAPADVGDLSWIQLGALAKSHEASISGSCWTANS